MDIAQNAKFSDNIELIKRSQNGDNSAMEELVKNNAGLVQSIAVKFSGRGVDFEDLVQIGNIGMLKAIRSFDLERGVVFSTYAVPLIFGEIRRFLRDDGLIKICRPQKKLGAMLMRAKENYISEKGTSPRIEEIAKICGVSPEEAASALCAVSPTVSLSEPLFGDEDNFTLENTLFVQDESDKMLERLSLGEALAKLPELWQKIVVFRYYRDLSQQSTAELLGLSQVKISREEKKLIEFLRKQMSS
ncbi:MAG: sigma-70 family RNA polymerase sigma factor [Ruminococcaceae bacterium]|nr:sigma-70 family RNA polymerase sigma factor [Oscillospiraceae bacterium]